MNAVNLNLKTLARQAATRLMDDSAIGKALVVQTASAEKTKADERRDAMIDRMAKTIEDTFRPFCNEEFQ